MSKRLPVPPELQHLLEKRERDKDRRSPAERRSREDRQADLGPLGAIESARDLDDVPTADRRRGKERRQQPRRKSKRRKGNT
jgi:hypothetical protein